MKSIFVLLLISCSLYLTAQSKTPSPEEAASYLARLKSTKTYVISDSEKEYEKYNYRKAGEIIIEGTDIYKILEFKETNSANYGFIFLDTNKLSPEQIKTLRENIIAKYKFGIRFSELSEQYSISKNPDMSMDIGTNDLGRQFQEIADNHYAGDIFTVDPPLLQNFAVVVKNTDATLKKFVIVQHAVYE